MRGEIVIRSEFAGAILGVKGSTIQNIRTISGGDVHISETRDGQTRMIEVHGDRYEARTRGQSWDWNLREVWWWRCWKRTGR